MARRWDSPETVIRKLREAELLQAHADSRGRGVVAW